MRPTTTTTVAPAPTTTTLPPTSGTSPPAADAYPGYNQVLSDAFSGTSLSQSTWNGFYQDPGAQFGALLSSHGSVANGNVTMSDYADAAVDGQRAGTGLATRTGWTSGMAFVRARADAGTGVTMCIGLIRLNTWPPEIDFYEDFPTSNARQSFTATTHYGSANSMIWKTNTSVDATQWHTYGVKWNSSTITYFVDGVEWASIPNPSPTAANGFSQPMKLFMQIETNDGVSTNSSTPAVVNMNVNWAAVYTPS
jgi:beta-glucanase (GH16 family)